MYLSRKVYGYRIIYRVVLKQKKEGRFGLLTEIFGGMTVNVRRASMNVFGRVRSA